MDIWPAPRALAAGHRASIAAVGICACLALIVAAEVIAILLLNHGVFSYTIDDAYIHLALSRRLQMGTYGINPGEPAAPSSSILWPLLLAAVPSIVPGWPLLPLFINVVSVLVIALVFWKVLRIEHSLTPWQLLCIGLSIAVALNLAGLATSGMEHGLQVALAVLGIWGLIELELSHEMPRVATIALILGPLVRYENLAITAPACIYLYLVGRRGLACSIFIATAVGIISFSIFLLAHGLSALPTSVILKTHLVHRGARALSDNIRRNMLDPQAWPLMLLSLLVAAKCVRPGGLTDRRFAGLALGSTALHFMAGNFNWYSRYEIYIVAVVLLILCGLYRSTLVDWCFPANQSAAKHWYRPLLPLALCAAVFIQYAWVLITIPRAANDIYLQQIQMAHFARDYWKQPVAVNDLGAVAFASDRYVLDLAGLASQEVPSDPFGTNSQWMDALARKHGVGLAMIYPSWYSHLPSNWTLLARLHLNVPRITPSDCIVGFYATAPDFVGDLRDKLAHFSKALPPGASLEMVRSSRQERRASQAIICPR